MEKSRGWVLTCSQLRAGVSPSGVVFKVLWNTDEDGKLVVSDTLEEESQSVTAIGVCMFVLCARSLVCVRAHVCVYMCVHDDVSSQCCLPVSPLSQSLCVCS